MRLLHLYGVSRTQFWVFWLKVFKVLILAPKLLLAQACHLDILMKTQGKKKLKLKGKKPKTQEQKNQTQEVSQNTENTWEFKYLMH